MICIILLIACVAMYKNFEKRTDDHPVLKIFAVLFGTIGFFSGLLVIQVMMPILAKTMVVELPAEEYALVENAQGELYGFTGDYVVVNFSDDGTNYEKKTYPLEQTTFQTGDEAKITVVKEDVLWSRLHSVIFCWSPKEGQFENLVSVTITAPNHAVKETVYCPECGATASREWKFCSSCGVPLSQ